MSGKCAFCGKAVYAMEALHVDKAVFHKSGCFRCLHCKSTLSPGSYASLGGKFYCKPHFKQLFALKGDYSRAFGEEKPADKWAREKNGGSAESPSPVSLSPVSDPVKAAVPAPDPVPAKEQITPAKAPEVTEPTKEVEKAAKLHEPKAAQAPVPAQGPSASSTSPGSTRKSLLDTEGRLSLLRLSSLTMEDFEKAQQKFNEYDLDGNGVIDHEEFDKLIATLHPAKSAMLKRRLSDMYFKQFDTNSNGSLDEIEFMRVYSELLKN
eukprot:TRINITY_DN2775_c0_g1_i1.p1 TRINITY_DN2775_c0_g1~~TRINITY_DN2775_c0_g1_i1.p1  ORF type:complete len:265 (+),score=71.88 TRINITY_DN2775_c0_g1_i1:90-884(+)